MSDPFLVIIYIKKMISHFRCINFYANWETLSMDICTLNHTKFQLLNAYKSGVACGTF